MYAVVHFHHLSIFFVYPFLARLPFSFCVSPDCLTRHRISVRFSISRVAFPSFFCPRYLSIPVVTATFVMFPLIIRNSSSLLPVNNAVNHPQFFYFACSANNFFFFFYMFRFKMTKDPLYFFFSNFFSLYFFNIYLFFVTTNLHLVFVIFLSFSLKSSRITFLAKLVFSMFTNNRQFFLSFRFSRKKFHSTILHEHVS